MTSTFKNPKHFSDNNGIAVVGDIYQVTAADVNNSGRVNYYVEGDYYKAKFSGDVGRANRYYPPHKESDQNWEYVVDTTASTPADTGTHTSTSAGPAHKDDECHCDGEQHTHHHHYHGGTHQHCHGGTHHHHHHHGDGQGTHTTTGHTGPAGGPITSNTGPAGGPITSNTGPAGGPITSNTGPAGGPITSNTGPAGGPIASNTGPAGNDPGDTSPRPVPSLPPKGQFTVTLINNEEWERTAKLSIDGKEKAMKVSGNKAITEAFSTTTGNVTIALFDSKLGAMRLPLNLNPTGHSLSFGAEKPSGEKRPDYTDVFVHIDWTTDVKN